MSGINAYKSQSAFGGWTRIEMLLAIYDRAIDTLNSAKRCQDAGDEFEAQKQLLKTQKAILAIHAGLKPDEDEIAFNIARLLHFVLSSIEQQKFDDAINILNNMRSGFEAIHDEARQMEIDGEITPLPTNDSYMCNA